MSPNSSGVDVVYAEAILKGHGANHVVEEALGGPVPLNDTLFPGADENRVGLDSQGAVQAYHERRRGLAVAVAGLHGALRLDGLPTAYSQQDGHIAQLPGHVVVDGLNFLQCRPGAGLGDDLVGQLANSGRGGQGVLGELPPPAAQGAPVVEVRHHREGEDLD